MQKNFIEGCIKSALFHLHLRVRKKTLKCILQKRLSDSNKRDCKIRGLFTRENYAKLKTKIFSQQKNVFPKFSLWTSKTAGSGVKTPHHVMSQVNFRKKSFFLKECKPISIREKNCEKFCNTNTWSRATQSTVTPPLLCYDVKIWKKIRQKWEKVNPRRFEKLLQ